MYSNPRDWWCQNGAQFPLLYEFFIANCSSQVTSTSSERAFSTDGLILTRFIFYKKVLYKKARLRKAQK